MSRRLLCARAPHAHAIALALLSIAVPHRADAGPVCVDTEECKRLCQDGGGLAVACTAQADALAGGRNGAPDHARAAELYQVACQREKDGDPEACLSLAALKKSGWRFEVEPDPSKYRPLIDKAYHLGLAACTKGHARGCGAAARAAEEKLEAADGDPKAAIVELIKLAETGCKGKDLPSCRFLQDHAHRWFDQQSIDDPEKQRLIGVARTGKVDACIAGDGRACAQAVWNDRNKAAIAKLRPSIDTECAKGDAYACMAKTVILVEEAKQEDDPTKLKAAVLLAIDSCERGDGHDECGDIVDALVEGFADGDLAADPRRGIAIGERRCRIGDAAACDGTAKLLTSAKHGITPDPTRALALRERACQLRDPDQACRACDAAPTAPHCQLRAAFADHAQCRAGRFDVCEVIGKRFRDGRGVEPDATAAARYFRRGCDGAQKGACALLDELCVADDQVDRALCHQSLIHTDLFYEAEWRFRTTGVAQLMDSDADEPAGGATASVTVSAGAAGSASGVVLARGHLDADLVVGVVLDRARQAAIRLVVDELTDAGAHARARYLRDLLTQGARLLADPTTLRREKFADLAMTVVRGFVAANLVDTLYADVDAVLEAPVIGAIVAADRKAYLPRGTIDPRLRAYLVDLTYGLLGETHLFAQVAEHDRAPPSCPVAAWKQLCDRLAAPDALAEALRVERVLDGLRLAKALREAGTLDLRRFIEAAARSRSIADLGATPGLVLAQWQTELVAGQRQRITRQRAQIGDLKVILRVSSYNDGGPEIAVLATRAAGARALLGEASARFLLSPDDQARVAKIVDSIEGAAKAKLEATDPRAELRAKVVAEIQGWGARDLNELIERATVLEKTANELRPALDQLERSIYGITAVMSRFHHGDGGVATLDIGDVPLHAIGELRAGFKDAVGAMRSIEKGLRRLYPGQDQPQLEFARSAAVRLLGLFDLLERVARATRLNQTTGDVIAAVRLLGVSRAGEFTAPLYDVLEPVLDSLKTHEPMSVDLLFAVIARVRLDTLIGSLQGGGTACKRDDSVDCWTVKIVHALQESVEREGDLIRVDGGKFAQRLAAHGDDFRRKHRWRGYFHLTVGVGGLDSQPPGEPDRRRVPVVAEQIGFGWASPAVWKDRLTFKVGSAASGVLYRAILDSSESKAIMIHPVFVAVDVYDLIELYASPLTVLIYPPEEARGTAVELGFSAGLSVPLSSYLERL